ncbi:MAG: STAS domain-containing protein [Pseudonocardiaceae bacterium]
MAGAEFPLSDPEAAAELMTVFRSDADTAYPNAVVLEPVGELDQISAAVLWAPLAEHLGLSGRHVVLDLSKITFFASIGIKIMVMASGRARTCGSSLAIVATTRTVRRPMQLLGVLDQLPVYRRRADALSAHPQHSG